MLTKNDFPEILPISLLGIKFKMSSTCLFSAEIDLNEGILSDSITGFQMEYNFKKQLLDRPLDSQGLPAVLA